MSDIQNNLTSVATNKPLSAAQGKILSERTTHYIITAITPSDINTTAGGVVEVPIGDVPNGTTYIVPLITRNSNSVDFNIWTSGNKVYLKTEGVSIIRVTCLFIA